MAKRLNFNIADIVFSILPVGNLRLFSIDNSHAFFKTDEEPDIILEVKRQNAHYLGQNKDIFDASTWLYSRISGNRHFFKFFFSDKDKLPRQSVILESDFSRGKIFLSNNVRPEKKGAFRNPFSYPLDEIVMISLLGRKKGLLIHSCGIKHKDKGYLFIGSSGAGKSTLAGIVKNNKAAHILGDDRVIARKKQGAFYVYGTPWCGEAKCISREKAPLSGLFFLKKDRRNYLSKMSVSDTVSELIRCTFLPFWDKKALSSSLKICEAMALTIPAFEFGFTPDQRAFGLIKDRLFD